MVKKIILFAPIMVFAVLIGYFAVGLTRDPAYIPSMLIDRPAPAFDLPAIQGYTEGFSNDDLHGRASLVNVFGSWCVSCAVEHPVLLQMEAEGVAPIYGLNWKDKPGAGAKWLIQRGDPYTLIGDDAAGRVAIDFGVTGAPETFVIDKNGRVRHKHIGPITPDDWRLVLKPMIADLNNASSLP